MNEKDFLEVEIENIRDACKRIQEALNDLKDVDGVDDKYKNLHDIAEDLIDIRMQKESKLARISEDGYELEEELEKADRIYQDSLDREWGLL